MAKQSSAHCDICSNPDVLAEVFVDIKGVRQAFDLCEEHTKALATVLPIKLPEPPKEPADAPT